MIHELELLGLKPKGSDPMVYSIRNAEYKEVLRISADFQRFTFTEAGMTFTWERLRELLGSQLARNLAEESQS